MSRLDRFRELIADEEVRSISRRYFISNGFDGTLTCVGIIVGSLLSGVDSGATVIKVGLGAAVGLGTSAVWSVWEIERAEKRAEIIRLEQRMLTDLDDTKLEERQAGARKVNAVMSGLGPLLGILLPLSPFLLEASLGMLWSTVAGVGIAVGLLFTFGAYLGTLSQRNWVVAGLRMGLAGLVVAGINVVLPG